MPVIVTVAESDGVMVLPSSSDSVAVTVSVSASPATPLTMAVKLHEYEPLAASVCGIVQLPWPSTSPWTSSISAVKSRGSAVPVLSTSTVKVTVPPGSSTADGNAVFVTVAVGATSVIVTVAESNRRDGVRIVIAARRGHRVSLGVTGITVDHRREAARVEAASNDRLRYRADALTRQVAVHIVAQRADRHTVGGAGVVDAYREGHTAPRLRYRRRRSRLGHADRRGHVGDRHCR